MKRLLLIVTLTLTLVLVFVHPALALKIGYFYGFDKEATVEPWTGAAYGGAPTVGPVRDILMLGKGSKGGLYAALHNRGARGAWMQTEFEPSANTIKIAFDIQDVGDGKRLAPIIYVGNGEPTSVYDFQMLGVPLGDGPQRLRHIVSLKEAGLTNDLVVVAIGTVNLDDNTFDQVAGIDNIAVTIYDQ
jgi:hypothetical protein